MRMPLVRTTNLPIGELKPMQALGLYRLYFAEPQHRPGEVVVLGLRLKRRDAYGSYASSQNADIDDARAAYIAWLSPGPRP